MAGARACVSAIRVAPSPTNASVVREIVGVALTVETVSAPMLIWRMSGVAVFVSVAEIWTLSASTRLLAPSTLAMVDPPMVEV